MKTTLMNRFALLLLVALASNSLMAQAPAGYYNNANGKTGDELKEALHDIIKGHHVVSYGKLLEAFAYTDCKSNGKIWDIYSNFEYSPSTGICGNYEQEGDCWNREHTWPQSWFNEQTTPRSDLFHVYPTDGYVNNRRSSYPYGEVSNPTYTSGNGSKLGPCTTSGYTKTVFEPIDEYKGDIARGFFYMSVRYYSEDSGWSSSDMTNKSEIEPWAMTMLLRWSDEDPVSDKEMARNNAVYGYQNNRNPFIDHPEYAHIIWDPDWTGVTYNITCASVQNGSISAPSSAVEGTMVTLTATPTTGYMLDSWSVYKTGDASTTVSVSSNGTFTMPSYNVTVSATFVVNNTYYDISCANNLQHGSISTSPTSAKSGTTITLGNTPASGYSLYSYYVYKTDDINTIVYSGSGNTFTMPAYDVTVSASFAQGSGGDYEKVTSALDDWSGEYLIVYEADSKAFDGSLTTLDAANNNITVSINNSKIESSSVVNASSFTIAKSGDEYSIKSASGYYVGKDSNGNGLQSSQTTVYKNIISYNSSTNSIDIVSSSGLYLRFNTSTNNGNRFRYYGSGQQPIQLYKKTSGPATTPTHTIQFYPNGAEGTMNDQIVNEFEPAVLTPNAFSLANHVFDSWNTAADGSGTTYFDKAIVTLLSDLTLYAQWVPTYSVTCVATNGTVTATPNVTVAGELVTITATADNGYELEYLGVTDAQNHSISLEGNQFEMPDSDVTVTATFIESSQTYTQKYYLVSSTDQLVAGRTYLIVNTSAGKAMGDQNDNYRGSVGVSISNNNVINDKGTACELTLGGSTDNWTFFDAHWSNTGGYLYAASSTANQLKTQASFEEGNESWKWSITMNGQDVTLSANQNSRNLLKYNDSNDRFSCYGANSSGVSPVQLFIRSEEIDFTESDVIASLNTFDKNTIHAGVTLTATNVLGKEMCNETSQLVIEDGAQLEHTTTGINATLKKTITAWSGDGGWYTIAAPFVSLAPSTDNGLIANDYDLYEYVENGPMEWHNYKPNGNFNLVANKGYLYANNTSKSLRMAGELKPGNYSSTIDLSYANSEENLKGWNLLGNPTAHEITFSKTQDVSNGYYYLNNSESWVYEPSNTIPVGRGFLVKANATGQTVTLNPQSKGRGEEKGQYLCLGIGDERAYVKLNEGVSMPLIDLKGHHAALYLVRDNKPYAMLVRDGATAVDLCFEPRIQGQYTLTIDPQGLALDYLHLIDHLTGSDIDLLPLLWGQGGLNQPFTYTFQSSISDYPNRFQLVFSPNSASGEGEAPFAYYNGSEWNITNTGEVILQVIDMMGRIVSSKTLHGYASLNTDGLSTGIYMMRLINGENVKVQKIVVR